MTTLKLLYQLVMSPEINPLRVLPRIVRFQVMVVLAYMWSVVFSLYIGAVTLLGPSILAHTILLIGVFFTHGVFERVRKGWLSPAASRNWRRTDVAKA